MQFGYLVCFCGFFFLSGVTQAEERELPSDDTGLARVLQHASETPASPYLLNVSCTDKKGIRSFELFPGGAAIWNRRSQITVPPSARSALLKTLAERKFFEFKDSYGGREQPAKSAAAARITCRIHIAIQDLEKTSMQMAGGEQSKRFSDLATELLDQAEHYVDSAVTPVDLQDALAMLHEGQLAPQLLHLRFVELPTSDDSEPGTILRLTSGQLWHQAYKPGGMLVEPTLEPLGNDQFIRLVAAMRTEQLVSLPANLWSEDQLELEVQVLAHKKVVLARRFTRLEADKQNPAQQRFESLLLELRELTH
ncbi:MAG: hypothetical protein QNK19_16445 [Xanthomonadales bacterium]|nr:hypothetical protein [Xanthomonadales bacterium]